MIFAGCDVGSLSAEAVIMKDGSIVAAEIMRVHPRPEQSASEVMGRALAAASLELTDIDFCVSTGYGRENIPFAGSNVSEISCHGRGAHWLAPSVRTIVDVGGQDCKVIRIDDAGRLVNFVMNDKCAAGTGRFLEFMARLLRVGIDELGPRALESGAPASITNVCSVFAETEVLYAVYEGKPKADIAAGINRAMAERVRALVKRIGIEEQLCLTGGVAKNAGVVRELEGMLEARPTGLPIDPQLVGALGACLFAGDQLPPQASTPNRRE